MVPERMKPYTLSACLLLMIVYLGVQALTGQRGLLSGGQRDALLDARETQLSRIVAEPPPPRLIQSPRRFPTRRERRKTICCAITARWC